ncbi:NUDIX domain-containing protein [Schaalia naturae]|uniref:NUDIX domain-containing protein n=1 Tax=Schaalia naturae TaxID=635203 RepID=A0ABW2SKN8_9ACTO
MSIHSFALVPAAYVILLRGASPTGPTTEALLQLRRNTGYMDGHWACGAAGHVEPGESVVGTAVREAREELGIGLSPADLAPLTGMHRTNGGSEPIEQRVDWFFACRRWSGEPRVMEPGKDAGLRWFPLGDLPEAVPPHEREVLEAVASGQVPPVMTFGFAPGEVIDRYGVARPH